MMDVLPFTDFIGLGAELDLRLSDSYGGPWAVGRPVAAAQHQAAVALAHVHKDMKFAELRPAEKAFKGPGARRNTVRLSLNTEPARVSKNPDAEWIPGRDA
jgi:hypothetical protein